MHKENIVYFSPQDSVVTLIFKPFYATNGAYDIYITNGVQMQKIGKGSFSDGIEDVFILPIVPAQLGSWVVVIAGAFASAYGHTQILVHYTFYQNGVALSEQITIQHIGSTLATQNDKNIKKI